jgi:hypothetical protein
LPPAVGLMTNPTRIKHLCLKAKLLLERKLSEKKGFSGHAIQ